MAQERKRKEIPITSYRSSRKRDMAQEMNRKEIHTAVSSSRGNREKQAGLVGGDQLRRV